VAHHPKGFFGFNQWNFRINAEAFIFIVIISLLNKQDTSACGEGEKWVYNFSQATCREELCEDDIKMNLEDTGYEGVNWFLLA